MVSIYRVFLLLCLLISSSYTQAITVSLNNCLQGKTAISIPLDTTLGNYIEGKIKLTKLDLNHEGVTLRAVIGGQNRLLFRNQIGEQSFKVWLPEQKLGSLTLQALHNTALCYDLDLTYGTAKEDQGPHLNSQPLSPRLQTLQQSLQQAVSTEQLLQTFWQSVQEQGTPLLEPWDNEHHLLTFLWRGAKHNVLVLDIPNEDDDIAYDDEWMQQLPDSDIWFKSVKVKKDIRFSYEIAADIPLLTSKVGLSGLENTERQDDAYLSTVQADPLNHKHFADISLVDFADSEEVVIIDKNPQLVGHLQQYAFSSQILANLRRVWIYQTDKELPDNTDVNWVYLFDGDEYVNQVNVPALLDRMYREGKIQSTIVVLIDNASDDARGIELPPNQAFADMLVDELIPFVQEKTGQQHNGRKTVVAGSSYGGLATASVAWRYPQYFGKVLTMSGSFWWPSFEQSHGVMANLYQNSSLLPLEWFMSIGRYEYGGMKKTSLELNDILRKKAYSVTFKEYPGGHDYAIWQQTLYDGLSVLLRRD